MNEQEGPAFSLRVMSTEDLQYSLQRFMAWQRRSTDPIYRGACALSIQEIADELARRISPVEFTLWYTDYQGPPIVPA